MILTKEVSVKVTLKNIDYYSSLGYNCCLTNIIKIKPDELSNGSNQIIDILCDYCNSLLKVPYKRYVKSISIVNKYSCTRKECSNQKIKDVCLKKYNVENPFQADFVKDKSKETLKKNYGVDHQMKLDIVKEKIKKTNIEKYGVDNYSKTNECKEKIKKTNIDKWGVEWTMQSDEVKMKSKRTILEKYGTEYASQSKVFRDKVSKTNIERYGFKTNLQSEDCKDKIRKTNIEKLGVDNPFKSVFIKNRIKEVNIEKYGVESYTKTDEFKEKIKQINIEKWGVEWISQSEEIRKKFNICKDSSYLKYLGNNISLFNCINGHEFEISTDNYYNRKRLNVSLCTICHPINDFKSIKENELFKYIESIYNGEIIQSYRDGLEIDIYLPELGIGFEFNGLYWHSDKYLEKNYHLDKTKYFKDRGIRVIHIWEDNWNYNKDIIKSQISNWLGLVGNKIFARKCFIKEVDNRTVKKFLNENHIQGSYNQIKISLGLFYNNNLVSVMTFDNFEGRKKMNSSEWNLSRFCNVINTNVIGGASKLLNYFIKIYNPLRIISYADRDWSNGNIYEILGFKKISESKPDYKYIINNKRRHKSNFRKKKGELKTESQIMRDFNKIWDCGKIKYEKSLKY